MTRSIDQEESEAIGSKGASSERKRSFSIESWRPKNPDSDEGETKKDPHHPPFAWPLLAASRHSFSRERGAAAAFAARALACCMAL